MTHDPLCGLSQPCDDETPEHGSCSMQHGEFCIHCHQWCICDVIAKVREDALAAAVQRVKALTPAIRRSNDDGMGGTINDQVINRPETFTEYLSRDAVIATIKGEQP